MKPPPLHAQLVADYVARRPETQRRKFVAALRDIVRRDYLIREQAKLEGWALEPVGFLPDAFVVNRKLKEITIVEAEVTSRISPAKWQNIIQLWWLLDIDEWDVWVHTVDRSGSVFSVDTPSVAVGERVHADDPVWYFRRVARQPPGRLIWRPGDAAMEPDDWPDAVAAYTQAHPPPPFDLNDSEAA